MFQGLSGEAQNLAETLDHPGASPPIPPFLEDLGKYLERDLCSDNTCFSPISVSYFWIQFSISVSTLYFF